ncbi:MAG: hypothetical protein COU47_04415 [Candidatus Niyogibacteria bacterium CG10_big_fil_rev_8_21_14_0_10_46_36]|uniref:Uncharacterized protein n=1 Tax=Candidatus Niyogibacteria bacterium CG10_big_fil_rev_8_21_14_0_10_46_36 TaxID=1974726 RepID=A0A2H0TCP6_9BACT|nr:MAG: hypothetical protein COU47_04415 [Candidatus Niyogibacteria bacterium CG10_big_fil_rev_8_21_14_0_10_46_36]
MLLFCLGCTVFFCAIIALSFAYSAASLSTTGILMGAYSFDLAEGGIILAIVFVASIFLFAGSSLAIMAWKSKFSREK